MRQGQQHRKRARRSTVTNGSPQEAVQRALPEAEEELHEPPRRPRGTPAGVEDPPAQQPQGRETPPATPEQQGTAERGHREHERLRLGDKVLHTLMRVNGVIAQLPAVGDFMHAGKVCVRYIALEKKVQVRYLQ